MKATFDGMDYTLFLNPETREMQRLGTGEKLEAPLKEHWGDKDLGKVVSLELAENRATDGIEFKQFPEDAENWEAIQKIQVRLNGRAYNHVRSHGQFGTRYNGSDKIEILIEDPLEG